MPCSRLSQLAFVIVSALVYGLYLFLNRSTLRLTITALACTRRWSSMPTCMKTFTLVIWDFFPTFVKGASRSTTGWWLIFIARLRESIFFTSQTSYLMCFFLSSVAAMPHANSVTNNAIAQLDFAGMAEWFFRRWWPSVPPITIPLGQNQIVFVVQV